MTDKCEHEERKQKAIKEIEGKLGRNIVFSIDAIVELMIDSEERGIEIGEKNPKKELSSLKTELEEKGDFNGDDVDEEIDDMFFVISLKDWNRIWAKAIK